MTTPDPPYYESFYPKIETFESDTYTFDIKDGTEYKYAIPTTYDNPSYDPNASGPSGDPGNYNRYQNIQMIHLT